jgi:hypothetical protein
MVEKVCDWHQRLIYIYINKNTVMAKAKQTKVEEVKQIVLTQDQFNKLVEIQSMLDNASDILDNIDGTDGNLYEIGKSVGGAYSDIIDAYNALGDIIDGVDGQVNDFDFDFEDEN